MKKTYTFTDEELKEKMKIILGFSCVSLMFLSIKKDEKEKEIYFDKIRNDLYELMISEKD